MDEHLAPWNVHYTIDGKPRTNLLLASGSDDAMKKTIDQEQAFYKRRHGETSNPLILIVTVERSSFYD